MKRRLVWFSCGAASAVLAKLAVKQYGSACDVIYCDTSTSEHPDNNRFFADVEKWIERPIQRIRSEKYSSIDEVFEGARYMAGPAGARCTSELKKLPREAFQQTGDIHLFGYTVGEERRAAEFEERNPSLEVEWLLIQEGVGKQDCYDILQEAGISLPAMYNLGFDHNNCLGCVKATSASYWNAIRRHFPEVYERRAKQSALLDVRLARVSVVVGQGIPSAKADKRNGKIVGYRVHLAVLPDDATGPREQIECGPVCQEPLDKWEDE